VPGAQRAALVKTVDQAWALGCWALVLEGSGSVGTALKLIPRPWFTHTEDVRK
jgi:hypothetical protein